jgi:hypothetical protein
MSSNFGGFFNWWSAYRELQGGFFNSTGSSFRPDPNKTLLDWTNDFTTVTVGTGFIYSFMVIVPLLLFVFFKWKDIDITLSEVLCLYGYTAIVYVPVSLLMVINYDGLRWFFIMMGFLWTSVVIGINLVMELKKYQNLERYLIALVALYVVFFQLILSLFIRIYYFRFLLIYVNKI